MSYFEPVPYLPTPPILGDNVLHCYACHASTGKCGPVQVNKSNFSNCAAVGAHLFASKEECNKQCKAIPIKCWAMEDKDTCTCEYKDVYGTDQCVSEKGHYKTKRACEEPCHQSHHNSNNKKHNRRLLIIGGIVGGIILVLIIIGIIIFAVYEHHKRTRKIPGPPIITA